MSRIGLTGHLGGEGVGGHSPPHSVSQDTKFVGNPNIVSLAAHFLLPITSVILCVGLSSPIINSTCWIPVGTSDVVSIVLIYGLGAGKVIIIVVPCVVVVFVVIIIAALIDCLRTSFVIIPVSLGIKCRDYSHQAVCVMFDRHFAAHVNAIPGSAS